MGLDLTDPMHRASRVVHYRRYLLAGAEEVAVIAVQDFDYHHYAVDRFLDREAFATRAEALAAPLDLAAMLEATDPPQDDPQTGPGLVLLAQVRRNVQHTLRTAPALGLEVLMYGVRLTTVAEPVAS